MAAVIHQVDSLQIGGAQTHLVTMLAEIDLPDRDQHRVVSLFGEGPVGNMIRALGIPVDILDLRPMLSNRQYGLAVKVLTEHCREYQPGIVEAHLTYSRLIGLFAAWRAGVPVRIGFEQGDVYLNSWKFRLANFAGQILADRIIVCSEALADWNRHTNRFSRHRMQVFHNCVDPDRFTPAISDACPSVFDRPPCRTVFCSVGTLGSGVNKRVDVSIRAIATARACGSDVGLVIAGDGSQRAQLQALARELDVEEFVLFLGMRSDLPAVLACCDAFCHAAEFEPFGIVCIEAMAMGLPVIVPDTGGMREAVEVGINGLIYPALDHETLAKRMVRLDADLALRLEMGRRGRLAVEAQFSARSYMERLDGLYAELLAEKQV